MRRLPLLVASAFFMQMLDATILNTAIPGIAASFEAGPLELHALVISYTLTVCMLIPMSGWAADRWGARRTMMAAILLFTLGSLLCALSTSIAMMTACRVLQGAGGAFLPTVGRLVILKAYPRNMFVKVFSFVTIPGLTGPLLGPALGGFLVQYASWHWIFLINIPVSAAAFLAARRLMPDMRSGRRPRFDWRGCLLFSFSLLLLTLSMEGTSPLNAGRAGVLTGAAGLALQAAYWLKAHRTANPLFSPALFRIRNFSIGLAGNIVCRLGGSCAPYLIPLYFQLVLGFSAFKSGLSLIPMALCNLSAKTWVSRFLRRFGYRKILTVNTLVIAAALASFSELSPGCSEWLLLLLLCLLGTANSIQFTCMNTLTLIDLPDSYASGGNSLLSVVMQLSVALSIAFASLTLDISGGRGNSAPAALQHAFQMTFITIGCVCALSALVFARVDRRKGRAPQADR